MGGQLSRTELKQKNTMDSSRKKYLEDNKCDILSRYLYNQSFPIFRKEIEELVIGTICDENMIRNSSDYDYYSTLFGKYHSFYRATIKFSDLGSFKDSIFKTFPDYWSTPVLIRTERSKYCYMYRIPSLHFFNWDFPFNLNEGILALISVDYSFAIILNWYEEDDINIIDIQIKKHNKLLDAPQKK